MKCKKCKRTIEDNSIFCNWCGTRQVKQVDEIKIPEPIQLPSGNWRIQLRKEGVSVIEDTPDKAKTKARAIRANFLKAQKLAPKITVGDMIDKFIDGNEIVLSPSTVKAYKSYRKHRFKSIINSDVSTVNWQEAVNAEVTEGMAPKTVHNAWRLITGAAKFSKVPLPDVKLPQKAKSKRPWLDYEQITKFLSAVKGEDCELAALIELHGLRRSELYHLNYSNIDFNHKTMNISGAAVYGPDGDLVHKDTNKNTTSQRIVPIVIPRLLELLRSNYQEGKLIVDPEHRETYKAINRICKKAGLPKVGNHGLRHSMVSLAFHLKWSPATTMTVGGYSNLSVVNDIYTHLAAKDRNKDIKKMEKFYSRS